MMKRPLISIIIPLYNKQDCILKTLNSVFDQDFNDYEIVIVDDGSTDNSIQIVESISDNRIHLFRKNNGGPSSARNYGVQKSQGKWVLFLDADDTLEIGALKQVEADIRKHRFADVFCYNLYLGKKTRKTNKSPKHVSGYLFLPFLYWFLDMIYPRTGNMVCKRKIMQKEPYREDFKRWEDGENTFRLMRKYRFYANSLPLFTYWQDSLAACKPRKNLSEDFICNMQPKGKSFFEQLCMYKLYKDEARYIYPDDIEKIYGDTFNKVKYWRADKYLNLYAQKKLLKYLRRRIKDMLVSCQF